MQESTGLGEQREIGVLAGDGSLGIEVVIGDKMIGEAASPFSFMSSFEHVSYLDAGHVPQPVEPWFRMKSILSSADELMFSENTEMPFRTETFQFFKEKL